MTKKNWITIAFVLAGQFVFAQQVLTLDSAIQTGLKNNYDIRIIKNDLEIAANTVTPGNAGLLPSLDVNGSLGGSSNDSKQRYLSGDENIKTGAKSFSLNGEAVVNWTLFDGMKMFITYDKLKEMEATGELNVQSQIENTVAQITESYYEVFHQQKILDALKDQEAISSFRKEIVEARYSVGSVSEMEKLKAMVDFNSDHFQVVQQEATLSKAKVDLNQLLASAVNVQFAVPDEMNFDSTLDYDQLRQSMLLKNTSLQLADKNLLLSQFDLKEINASKYPRIGIDGGYNYLQSQSQSGFVTYNRNQGFFYGVNASINLFNGFQLQNKTQNLKIEIQNAELSKEQTSLDLEAQLSKLFSDYLSNVELYRIEKENVEYALRSADVAKESFQLGRISDFDLRDIQKSLITAQTQLVEAAVNGKKEETELLLLSGRLLNKE